MSEITELLKNVAEGDATADQLLPVVYDELRKLAAIKMAAEKPTHTLQATALVHEAYARLVKDAEDHSWSGRGHFFAAAAEAMRRILVENARRKRSEKHGGQLRRKPLEDHEAASEQDDILALDEALKKLSDHDATAARVVELRYFAGLGHEDIAATLDLTVYRARQKWTYARAWLRKELEE